MTAIEKMLTGKMDMCAFMDLLKSDQNVQETIRNLVPQSAIANKEHRKRHFSKTDVLYLLFHRVQ